MIKRNIQPPFKPFENLEFAMPEVVYAEDIPIYLYRGGRADVCRIDLIFHSGSYCQESPAIAKSAADVAIEASKKKSAKVVAETFDFYGGWVKKSVSYHYTIFTLYSLNRHYKQLLRLFLEVITLPRFSKLDVNRYKKQSIENLKINEKRVDYISSKIFKKNMFGSHPYGVTPCTGDYEGINSEVLERFTQNWYSAKNCSAVLSGAVSDDMVTTLQKELLTIPNNSVPCSEMIDIDLSEGEKYVFERVDNALQSSVRIGCRTINRDNEAYIKLHILNSAFGGYFNSRLNKNIREDKGYTYGIASWLIGLPDAAHLVISSQTATHFTKPLINEVKIEIDKLKQKPIPDDELQCLKGYLTGDIAQIFDNNFTLADSFITIITNNLPLNYYNQRVDVIRNISSDILLETAQKYLPDFDDMSVVIAGKLE